MSVASPALAGGFFITSTTWEGWSDQKLLRNQTCIFMPCPKRPRKLLAQASPRVSSKFAELTAVRTTQEAWRTLVLTAHLMDKRFLLWLSFLFEALSSVIHIFRWCFSPGSESTALEESLGTKQKNKPCELEMDTWWIISEFKLLQTWVRSCNQNERQT